MNSHVRYISGEDCEVKIHCMTVFTGYIFIVGFGS